MKFILFCYSFLVSISSFSQNVDINLLKSVNVDRNKSLDGPFEFVTNSVTPLTIGVPVSMITYAIITKDSTDKSNAIVMCSSLLLAGIVTNGIKYVVNRERPFDSYPFIQKLTTGSGPSFPSGHTSSAFAIATSLSMAYPKWYVISGSFAWATAVGYSRMDLGVHYPSDVLVGAIVGSGSAFLSKKLTRWINSKGKRPIRKSSRER